MKSLSDYIEIIGGGTPKTDIKEYWGGDIPWLSVNDFNDGFKIVYKAEKSITKEGLVNSATKILEPGQLIISARGTVGVLAQIGLPMAFNQSCYGLSAKPEYLTNDYLYYLLKTKIKELKEKSHGAVFDTITRNTFEQIFIFPLPPLPEQERIAGILSAYDDKIALNRCMAATLEQMARTLFRQLPRISNTKVSDYAKINANSIGKNFEYNEILYLDTGSVNSGHFGQPVNLIKNKAPSRAKRLVNHNDILISTVRPDQNHYGIIRNPPKNLVVSTGFCAIESVSICPYFLYLLLTEKEMTSYFHSIADASTSTFPSLRPNDIGELEITIPPKEALEHTSKIWETFFEKTDRLHIENQHLAAQRDLLLQKLFNR